MTDQYHFIGVGGIGMSGLARILLAGGARVSGSDQADSERLHELARLGARVFVGHGAGNAPGSGTVVISDAIRPDNPELAECEARGLTVIRRSQLLGEMMRAGRGIAVSGTHGKTTTTAMIACILIGVGADPTVVVGGDALGPDRNARAGAGRWFVAEACEAYGSFLHLSPEIAVVTNIEPDHLDHHGDFEHIRAAFREFAGQIRPGGVLIANADDGEAACLAADSSARTVTYGLNAGLWRAADIRRDGLGSRFTVMKGDAPVAEVALGVPGDHNVSNAMGAIVAAAEAGVAPAEAAAALASYAGVGRRFEHLGDAMGARVYDDYAHHPTEIRETLKAARAAFPEARLVAVFQPHLYSRTRDFMDDFVRALDGADVVAVTDIYRAREEPIPGVRAEDIILGLGGLSPQKPAAFVADRADVPAWLAANVRPSDVVIVIGAGDIRKAGEAFVAEFGR